MYLNIKEVDAFFRNLGSKFDRRMHAVGLEYEGIQQLRSMGPDKKNVVDKAGPKFRSKGGC